MNNLIVASWLLYVGFMPTASLDIDDATFRYNNSFIQVAGFDFTIADHFRFWTEIEIREVKSDSFYFDPYRAGFRVGADFLYRNWILGISHECNHDVVTGNFLNSYNGLDMAYDRVYAGWSVGFPVHPDILVKPGFFLGFRSDGLYSVKYAGENEYFGPMFKYVKSTDILYSCIQAEAAFFDRVRLSVACLPEYSLSDTLWSRVGFNTGLEVYYRNIAMGIEGKNQVRLDKAGWAFNELRLYVSFRGKSFLL